MGIPEYKEMVKGTETLFNKIILENFSSLGIDLCTQIRLAQTTHRFNSKRSTSRPIIIKLSKVKGKENFKSNKRKKKVFVRLSTDFSAETFQARRKWDDILKMLKEKSASQEYST